MPAIRRIFVPVDSPSRWPKGDWDPIRQVELERCLEELRDERPQSELEKAEYRARLVGDSFEDGHFEWKSRPFSGRARFLSLSPSNLTLGQLAWADRENSPKPAIWGTGPDSKVGLLLEGAHSRLTGTWALTGRRLPRSLEFNVQLPVATVSHLSLELPTNLRLSSSAGEVTGPQTGMSPDSFVWNVNLGSRSECRLRITSPGVESSRRPLSISQVRTNYVLRPEVVRVLAEIEVEAFESSLRELRLQVDRGIQVVAVEHGDEIGVAWKSEPRPEGDLISVSLPEPISSPPQMLRLRGIATIKPGDPWSLPRVRALDTIPRERLVTVRMQPPFQAADLRLAGYRQIELTASPNEGETIVLRQIAEEASVVVVPAEPRVEAVCRSLAVVQFQGDEWNCAAQFDLQASSGSAFEADLDVPEGWEVISVRSETSKDVGELNHWDVSTGADGRSRLRIDFQASLDSTRPQRIRIAAQRPALAPGEWFAVPMFSCRGEFSRDATTVFVPPEEQRPVFRDLIGVETSNASDLSPEQKQAEPLQSLPAEQLASAIVVRSFSPSGAGQMSLRKLHSPVPEERPGIDGAGAKSLPLAPPVQERRPFVATRVEAVVELAVADAGSNSILVNIDVVGSQDDRLTFELPDQAELIAVRVDGEVAHVETGDGSVAIDLRDPLGDNSRRLSIEYRLPSHRTTGPNRLRLGLPRLPFPVMRLQSVLQVASTLRSTPRSGWMEWTADHTVDWAPSLLGPLGRVGDEELFRPWRGGDWRRLWSRFASSEIGAGAESGSKDSPGSGIIWRGTSLGMTDALEVDVWNRIELEALEWALTFAAVLSVLIMRAWAPQWRRRTALLVLSGLVLLAFSGWPWMDEIVGSALTGLSLSVLLPASLLKGSRLSGAGDSGPVPSGSTRTFTHGFQLVVLSLISLTVAASAQEPASQKRAEPEVADSPVDVLFPVGADGKPIGSDPLCYVRAGFLNELERLKTGPPVPNWLIAGESVEFVIGGLQEARITVRLDVLVLSHSDPVSVELPIRNAIFVEKDGCLVDGKPQPVLLSGGGRGVVVELPGLTDVPVAIAEPQSENETPADTGAKSVAIGNTHAARHTVEFRLRALVEPDGSEFLRSRLTLPRVADATVSLKSELPAIKWLEMRGPGIVPRQSSSNSDALVSPVTLRGLFDEVEFRWSVGAPPARRATELDVSMSAIVDVHPGLARSNWHVTSRVLAGVVDGFALTLPEGATLESVQSPGLGGFVVEPAANGRRHLILEYGTPQSGNLSATVSLLQPLSSLDVSFPILELADLAELPNRTTLRRCQLGFRQPLDYRLSVAAATPDLVVRPRTVDEFLKEWPMAGARPQQAIELARPGALQLTLQELSGRLVSRSDVRGRFSPGVLDWVFSAEVDQPVVPPFHYRLSVDPRLVIRKVTVQEDGAERLLRWSRIRDTLVLFLNDRAARGQTIRLEATMSIPVSGDLTLPKVDLEGAQSESRRVSLYQESGASVSLIGASEAVGSAEGPAAHTGQPGLVARYENPMDSPPRQVRLLAADTGIALESAIILTPRGDQLELTQAFEFKVASGRAGRFDVKMPRQIAERYPFVSFPDSQQMLEPASDGDALLSFFPAGPVSDRFVVRTQFPVQLGPGGALLLPRFLSPGLKEGPRWLILPRDRRSDYEPAEVPAWISRQGEIPIDLSVMSAYRLPDTDLPPLIQIPSVGEVRPPTGLLADFKLEFHEDGSTVGQLLLWLSDGTAESLDFDWPSEVVPSAVLVDGLPVAVSPPASETWRLPLPARGARLVWLSWRSFEQNKVSIAHQFQDRLPRPRIPVDVEIVDIRIGSKFVQLFDDDLRPEQSLGAQLIRWGASLNSIERETPLADAGTLVLPYIRRVAKQAARRADDVGNSVSKALEKRLEELDERTQNLEVPSDVSTSANNRVAEALAETVGGSDWHPSQGRTFIHHSPDDDSAGGPIVSPRVWGIRQTVLSPVIGVAIGIALILVLWRSGRLILWIQEREGASWLAVGMLWWFVLRPSPLGLLIMLWGGWRVIRPSSTPRPEPGSISP